MVTPDCRRLAVVVLRDRVGVSGRRAYQAVVQRRSTQRHPPPRPIPPDDVQLRSRLRRLWREQVCADPHHRRTRSAVPVVSTAAC